jgi:hypothetical protein
MKAQQRVTLRFGNDSEVQYLRDVPEIGDYVSHHSALWVVSKVENDGLGALVTCEPAASAQQAPGPAGTVVST